MYYLLTYLLYIKDFIVEHMGVPAENITNVYNGTPIIVKIAHRKYQQRYRHPPVQAHTT